MYVAACEWKFEFDGAFEGRNHITRFIKLSAMSQIIRLICPGTLLCRIGDVAIFSYLFFILKAMHTQCTYVM